MLTSLLLLYLQWKQMGQGIQRVEKQKGVACEVNYTGSSQKFEYGEKVFWYDEKQILATYFKKWNFHIF